MENMEPREVFRTVADSISQDRKIKSFDQPEAKEVSWLAKEPVTDAEIAENMYERMRSMGLTISFDKDDVQAMDFMTAYIARKKAQGRG